MAIRQPARHSQPPYAVLVDELDARLPREPIIIADPPRRRLMPAWLVLGGFCLLVLASGLLALREPGIGCMFDEPVCAIERLDIDAVHLAIPDADLFDVLPPLNVIDPADELTLADVLQLDAVSGLDPNTLIRASEVDRVLGHID